MNEFTCSQAVPFVIRTVFNAIAPECGIEAHVAGWTEASFIRTFLALTLAAGRIRQDTAQARSARRASGAPALDDSAQTADADGTFLRLVDGSDSVTDESFKARTLG